MDPVNQDLFKDVILEQNRKGATILFSTHQMDTGRERLCRAIGPHQQGKVVLSGALSEVKQRFGKSSVVIEYEGDGSFLRASPGVAHADVSGEYAEVRLSPGADAQGLLRSCVDKLRIRRFEVVAPTLPQHLHRAGRRGGRSRPAHGRLRCIRS
jgi:ABC-2 type transport system ATP-binding protein